jgi:cytidylate kinase
MAVITISRQFGAGGKTIGKLVSQKLGYAFIDDEIINKVAEMAKVSDDWVYSIEQEAGGKLMNFISKLVSKGFIERILDEEKGYIDEDIYIETLKHVLQKFAEQDNCVLLGRGGQYFLKDFENAIHIDMIAELKDRIKFMEDNYKLSYAQAKNSVNVHGKRRQNLYMKIGKQDYDNPNLYTLVLNMSKLGMKEAVEIVSTLANSKDNA